ncbi:hypothetical protein [Acidomonas methanolica]|uniref:Uncharacterized protein n=1 Tax=Acidomonas methanolica NBRC 104435 TaxID=1231351 RepID=A0A023D4T1_ACIMT|nr:hypothetical protein [Acidomonas methanolica]MBU2653609.1 hypothetical protein [Acidomonas methanolica]MCQ9154848.1 hypothetical protein [Acidomonas methanolica]TCS31560.1 hypothetical protein EDC31_102109 [Acidomonas methanolica]GAJ28775.1 hypothetical protein Amme_038_024 [Acidomonas methanolica NBRC 104435]GBQ56071.1 hypothetical protein AA0498_2344 [Acidomonas methanolica]
MPQLLPLSSSYNAACRSRNVVPFRLGILPRHREYLSRWLDAGQCMGIFDADIAITRLRDTSEVLDHVLIWVRENADPAYMIRPQGTHWVLIDQIRGNALGSYRSFELALHTIRPVLPLNETAAA